MRDGLRACLRIQFKWAAIILGDAYGGLVVEYPGRKYVLTSPSALCFQC